MRFSTRAIHAGQSADAATGATIVPLYQTSTFTQSGPGEHLGYEYSRSGNPTRTALETCLAALEEAPYGSAFASGLAAETAVLSLLAPGDHIVANEDLYGGTVRLLERVFVPLGIETTYVDGTDAGALEAAVRPTTRMLWIETPSNPLLHLTDIAAAADLAHAHEAMLVVDNTFATPFLQRPLDLGADLVVHSTTKYLGGHSDAVGGAVVTHDASLHERIRFYQNAAGSVPGIFDAWLTLRGIKTLAVRMREHETNAHAVAAMLATSPQVETVYYPGLPSHPGHELAQRQMSGFGGMVSARLRGGLPAADRFLRALRVFSLAESLGGVESLACHPASMTHVSLPEADRERRGISGGLVRLSVGIEDVGDLLDDLRVALHAAASA
ncbi:MAG: cystathionine gamma-synthase [Coriobacteriia bacterium]